ncbi:hypothetical protein IMZ48_12375 [Candidatus Bathyarchaeota archaeon]|nr:hypothetical protein [Candidatus Bathyarchaeota archaeon]
MEVFDEICAHLVPNLGHLEKRDLAALASASKTLRFVTSRHQFQTIQIRFGHKTGIPQEVERWRALIDTRGCAPHVRRLAIVDEEEGPNEPHTMSPRQWPPESRKYDLFKPSGQDVWPLDKDDEFWTRPGTINFNPWGPVPNPSGKAEEQALWAPLADLIASLPGLGDVEYQCKSQIPVNLLTVLNEKDGGPVRLHMYAFSLRSIFQNEVHPHDIDEDEFYLATSPCLSSIRTAVLYRYSNDHGWDFDHHRLCFNQDAVALMMQGLAPNLKSATVDAKDTGSFDGEGLNAEWPGFFPSRPTDDTGRARGRGALETLALESGTRGGPDIIRAWAGRTDFGALRSLHLRNYSMNVPSLNALSEIAESAGLRSLQRLSLWLAGYWGPDEEDDWEHGWEDCDTGGPELARLLTALPPLQFLEMNGTIADEGFRAVLSSHGPSLRGLRLVPDRNYGMQPGRFVLSRESAEALVRACPNIQDLELLVPRSRGDEAEARIYRALAELRVLERLSLLLDCSNNVLTVEVDLQDREFRESIINLNTSDRALATDIFDALCQHRSPRLIRLYPEGITGMGGFGVEERSMKAIRDILSRAWIRERDDREGHAGEARLTEVKPRDDWGAETTPIADEFHGILEDIWPEAERWPKGGGETRRSFPLWKPS